MRFIKHWSFSFELTFKLELKYFKTIDLLNSNKLLSMSLSRKLKKLFLLKKKLGTNLLPNVKIEIIIVLKYKS